MSRVEYRKQFIGVAIVAGILALFEAAMFYKVVVPDAVRAIDNMLARYTDGLQWHPVGRALFALLGEYTARQERKLTAAHNHTGMVIAILIGLVPLSIAFVLWVTAIDEMRGHGRDVLFSVMFIVCNVLLFQFMFYFFARNWRYTEAGRLGYSLCQQYQDAAQARLLEDIASQSKM